MKLSLRLSLLLLLPLCVGTLQATALDRHRLVRDARSQIGVTTSYDPAYRVLGFPMGDVMHAPACARMWLYAPIAAKALICRRW